MDLQIPKPNLNLTGKTLWIHLERLFFHCYLRYSEAGGIVKLLYLHRSV